MVPIPGIGHYPASKGGVRSYAKSVALSCAEKGLRIRVNPVHPGFIDRPMLQQGMAQMGEPEDIAWGVPYLASDESKVVTGAGW